MFYDGKKLANICNNIAYRNIAKVGTIVCSTINRPSMSKGFRLTVIGTNKTVGLFRLSNGEWYFPMTFKKFE